MLVGRSDCLPDCLTVYLLYTEPPLFWVLFCSLFLSLVVVRVVVVRVVVLLFSLLSRVTLVCFSCGCCIFPVTFTEFPIGLP